MSYQVSAINYYMTVITSDRNVVVKHNYAEQLTFAE